MASVPAHADRSRDVARAWLVSALADDSPAVGGLPHSLEVVSIVRRPICTMYRLQWKQGDELFVARAKQYREWRLEQREHGLSANSAPRLFAATAVVEKPPLEFAALQAIYARFHGGAEGFAAVRPLALLPTKQTIVLEELPQPNLATVLSRCHRFGKRVDNQLQETFYNTGAWLRQFHEIPALAHTELRHGERAEVTTSIECACDFIASAIGDRQRFERVKDSARAAWTRHAIDLPCRLNHADFAPRNVLVGSHGQVAVIDTLARWQAPIYEDIAHFLVAMEATELQMLSQGLASSRVSLNALRARFVAGYFRGQSSPWKAIGLFELQAVLYKWVAVVAGLQESTGIRRLAKRGRAALRNRYLGRYVARMVQELDS